MSNEKCKHKVTFKTDNLFKINPLFSVKTCEICGKKVTLDTKYKIYILMFVLALVLILVFGIPPFLTAVFPKISYFSKGLVAVLIFVFIYSVGLIFIMQKATYHIYVKKNAVDNLAKDAYKKARDKAKDKILKK